MVAMYCPTLKQQLMIFFAEELLCEFHRSTQTTTMLDLGDALITQGLEARTIFSKRCESLRTPSTTSRVSTLFSVL